VGRGQYLDQNDYGLFIIQVWDHAMNAVEDIDWHFPEAAARARKLIRTAVDKAWRVGITVEQWEDGAAQMARELCGRGGLLLNTAATSVEPLNGTVTT
jgi:hypothetical protein